MSSSLPPRTTRIHARGARVAAGAVLLLALATISAGLPVSAHAASAQHLTQLSKELAKPAKVATPVPTYTVTPTQLGHLTWSFAQPAPADKAAAITDAMNTAIRNINTVADYSGNVGVTYNEGVPTAQASFGGWVEFGGTISAGVAQHELGHWLGSGTYWDFGNHVTDNVWTGPAAASRERAYDGVNSVLHSDGTHFWPYGWNYSNEYSSPQREIGLVSAQRADMGLSDGMAAATGTVSLQNRANGLVSDTGSTTSSVVQHSGTTTTGQKWTIKASNGYWTLTNTKTGKNLDSVGRTTTGSTVSATKPTAAARQRWEIVPTDSGYFQLQNRSTGLCLDTGGLGAGKALQSWPCGAYIPNQQWRFATTVKR